MAIKRSAKQKNVVEALKKAREVLDDVREYFADCADVDDGIPNKEMRLLTEIEAVLKSAV